MIGAQIALLVLGAAAVATALVVVFHKNPIVEALALVLHLLTIAGLFVLAGAKFMAVLQVIIYAGAIVVLITFVIMLLNLQPDTHGGPGILTIFLAFALGAMMIAALGRAGLTFEPHAMAGATGGGLAPGYGGVGPIANALFTTYFYPFEIISLAIVAALTGAVLLAKRNLED